MVEKVYGAVNYIFYAIKKYLILIFHQLLLDSTRTLQEKES